MPVSCRCFNLICARPGPAPPAPRTGASTRRCSAPAARPGTVPPQRAAPRCSRGCRVSRTGSRSAAASRPPSRAEVPPTTAEHARTPLVRRTGLMEGELGVAGVLGEVVRGHIGIVRMFELWKRGHALRTKRAPPERTRGTGSPPAKCGSAELPEGPVRMSWRGGARPRAVCTGTAFGPIRRAARSIGTAVLTVPHGTSTLPAGQLVVHGRLEPLGMRGWPARPRGAGEESGRTHRRPTWGVCVHITAQRSEHRSERRAGFVHGEVDGTGCGRVGAAPGRRGQGPRRR